MIALHWLYLQRADAEMVSQWRPGDGGGTAYCWLCGLACPAGAPSQSVKVAIRDTFTDHELARYPESSVVCPACSWYLDHAGVKADGLVLKSWRITPTAAIEWTRETMRSDLDALLLDKETLDEPTVLAVALSKKKHILLRALANHPSNTQTALVVQLEQQGVAVIPSGWQAVTTPFDRLRRLGHSKTEIVTGNWHPLAIKRDAESGRLMEALHLMEALRPWRGGALLALVSYVSPGGDVSDGARDERGGTAVPTDGDARAGDNHLESGVGRNRPGLQSEISDGHLAAVAKPRGGARTDDEQPGYIRQSSLWNV